MDELNKVGHKTEDVRKKLKKTESMFDAEQRKNGELMDELRAEQWKAMRAEQNRVAKDHDSMAEELKKTKKQLIDSMAHEAELEKKVTDLTHAKDLSRMMLWTRWIRSTMKWLRNSKNLINSRRPLNTTPNVGNRRWKRKKSLRAGLWRSRGVQAPSWMSSIR
jgi:hypothetical protein